MTLYARLDLAICIGVSPREVADIALTPAARRASAPMAKLLEAILWIGLKPYVSIASTLAPSSISKAVARSFLADIPHMCKGVAPPVVISSTKSGYF